MDYPHDDYPDSPYPWLPQTLYAITGWYSQRVDTPAPHLAAIAFSGCLKVRDGNGGFDGELTDLFGQSVVKGKLAESTLTIVKCYADHRASPWLAGYPIDYSFTMQDGVWVGGYEIQYGGRVWRGEARCHTFAAIDDAHGIIITMPHNCSWG